MKPITKNARISALALASLLVSALHIAPGTAQADSTVGAWGPVQNLSYRPVHSVLLETGKVWWWSADNAQLWDPNSGAIQNAPTVGYNIFCTGHSRLADGRILLTGGHVANNVGEPKASIYDPIANSWERLPDMNAGRWYPTQLTLSNGDVVTMSGDIRRSVNTIPQVWEVANHAWRTLTGADLGLPLYPAAFLASNGKVFVATSTSRYLDTSGVGAWTTVANRKESGRDNYGSACMYGPNKVIYTGGGDPPTATCEVIDLSAAAPAWNYVASMPEARRQHNVTILPDGTLLVTGGSSRNGFNTDDGSKPAINYDPDSNTWTTWAMEAEYRGYHSEAVLLPDGRVASIGGDNHPSVQVFSPPYLFKGTRPVISSAPVNVTYGQTFLVETADASSIAKVTWLRPAAVTHTKNMDQRINVLAFSTATGGLNVTAPASANDCPPGDYLLFLVNGSGIPSVASFIRIQ